VLEIAVLEMAGKNETEFWEECPYLPACLNLEGAIGYSGMVAAPTIAPWWGS